MGVGLCVAVLGSVWGVGVGLCGCGAVGCGAVGLWGCRAVGLCGCGAGVVVAVRLCLLEIWNILRAARLVGLWGCAREGGGPRGGLRAVRAEMRARGAREAFKL